MSKFAGFEIETPQQMLQKMAAKREKMNPRNGTHQQQLNNTDDAGLAAIFQTDEQRTAEKLEAARDIAYRDNPKREGEDDIAYRTRQAQSFYDQVQGVDAEQTAAAAEQLTMLENERMQRDTMLAQSAHAKNVAAQHKLTHSIYRVTSPSGETQLIDASTEAGRKTITGLELQGHQVELQQAAIRGDEQDAEKAKAAALARKQHKVMNTSDFIEASGSISKATDMGNRSLSLIHMLGKSPEVLSQAGGAAKSLTDLAINLGATSQFIDRDKSMYAASDDDVFSRGEETIRRWLKTKNGTLASDTGYTQSSIMDLAYAFAKVRDEGGRLSDRDVQAAIDMLGGGSANPKTMYKILIEQQRMTLEDKLSHWGSYQDKLGADWDDSAMGMVIDDKLEKLQAKYDEMTAAAMANMETDFDKRWMLGVIEGRHGLAPEEIRIDNPNEEAGHAGGTNRTSGMPDNGHEKKSSFYDWLIVGR